MLATLTALAEPTRLRIVTLLRGGPRPVNDIGDLLELPQPQVSKHLRVLKLAGLVNVEARAQQRVYQLRAGPLHELNVWLEGFRAIWEERFEQLDEVLADLQRAETARRRKRK